MKYTYLNYQDNLLLNKITSTSSINISNKHYFPYVYNKKHIAAMPFYSYIRWENEDWDLSWSVKNFKYSLFYCIKSKMHYETASLEIKNHFKIAQTKIPKFTNNIINNKDNIILSFVGDILWVNNHNINLDNNIINQLSSDIKIANLETNLFINSINKKTGLPYRFISNADLLDNFNFDLLQLNNNHTLDNYDEGILSTINMANKKGCITTGINNHVIVDIKNTKIAFLSYTWGSNIKQYNSQHELFVVPYCNTNFDFNNLLIIKSHIESAKLQGADNIVLLLHWGYEYEYYPEPCFMQIARELVSFGADIIIGHGPHVVQPAEICYVNYPEFKPGLGQCSIFTQDDIKRQAAIFYSLGNFTNDTAGSHAEHMGIIGKVSLNSVSKSVNAMGWHSCYYSYQDNKIFSTEKLLSNNFIKQEYLKLTRRLGKDWRF